MAPSGPIGSGGVITFSDVTVQYPGQDAPAVERFSLEAPSGKITVLLGSSGCGKTTLLQCVNQLVAPSSGTVTIDGRDVREEKPTQLRRSIGYVLQHSGLLPHRTVADNIATVLRLNGVKKSESRQRALQAAERVGLGPELMSRFPNQLSGGQQQRVAVARALAPDPSILLMDEPFGAVDPIVRRGLQDQLLALQEDLAKTILLVTHDVTEALTLEALKTLEDPIRRKQPFYLYFAHYSNHTPIQRDERFIRKYLDAGMDEQTAAVVARFLKRHPYIAVQSAPDAYPAGGQEEWRSSAST